jgi:type I restriction enzyme S subunit
LTADWRETHQAASTGEDFLKAMQKSRRARVGECLHPPASHEIDGELPESWAWTTIGGLVDVATGATPLRSTAAYYGGSVPWVTSAAVNAGVITESKETITDLALRETNAKVFPVGTLLLAMYGEGQTRGRVAELGIAAATNQAVAALLFNDTTSVVRPYLRLFLLSNYERIRALSFGGVQPNLSLGVVRDTAVPVPPVDEQAVICEKANAILRVVDGLQRRIDQAEGSALRTAEALAAKAFHGELQTV